jgi:hypothetical protein
MTSRIVCMLPTRRHAAHFILSNLLAEEVITVIDPGKCKGKALEPSTYFPGDTWYSGQATAYNAYNQTQAFSNPHLKRRHEDECANSQGYSWHDALQAAALSTGRGETGEGGPKRRKTESSGIVGHGWNNMREYPLQPLAGPSGC